MTMEMPNKIERSKSIGRSTGTAHLNQRDNMYIGRALEYICETKSWKCPRDIKRHKCDSVRSRDKIIGQNELWQL